jgi:DNA-binding transcriptional ArsR family regulator
MLPHHPDRAELELPTVLHALSDPQRLRIVGKLAAHGDAYAVPCSSFGLDVTKSTLTHHFRVLREAGIIHQEIQGTSKLNTLRREDLNARFPGLLDAVLDSTDKASLLAPPPAGETASTRA